MRRAETLPTGERDAQRLRVGLPSTVLLVRVALAIALLAAAADLPNRWAYIESILPIAAKWSTPDEQYKLAIAPAPYDLLKAADAIIPRDATVLLVTSGRDVMTSEYITYHRALYFLAPRPVWWISAASPDGSWKSRWWIQAPLTSASVAEVASARHATYVLAYNADPLPGVGRKLLDTSAGFLLQLSSASPQTAKVIEPTALNELWPFQAAAALLIILLFGSMAITVAAHLRYQPAFMEALGLAWALGTGLLSMLMLVLNALNIDLNGQIALLTGVGVAWGIGWLWKQRGNMPAATLRLAHKPGRLRQGGAKQAYRGWRGLARWSMLAFLGLQTAFVLIMAVGRPLQVWDSWVNWAMKARIIFLEGHITPALYADASRTVTQLDYPLLIPLVQSWLFGWLGTPDDRLVGIISVLFYLALAAICYAGMVSWGLSRTTALLAATVIGTISFTSSLAGIVFAEMPLMVFGTIAGIYLVKWLQGGPAGTLVIAGLGAGLMPWTKREGAVLLVALCLGALLTNGRSRRAWLAVGTFLIAATLLSGPWYIFVGLNHVINAGFLPVTLNTLVGNLGRWQIIVNLGWNSLTNYAWGYIWPLAVAVGLVTWRTGRRPTARLLPVMTILYIIMVGFMYVFSAFVPLEQHILSSVDRLFAQVAPLVVVWLACRALPVTPTPDTL